VRSRRDAQDRADEVAVLLAERYRRNADAQLTAERLAISRDLHDSLGHANAVVALHAQVAAEAVGHDDAAARQALEVISSTTAATMAELRRTVALLRGGSHPQRDVARLRDLDAAMRPARQAGIEVVTEITLPGQPLPGVVETAAHRIVQESIVNVVRHAAASRVVVDLRVEEDTLQIRVRDDGPPAKSHLDRRAGRPTGHGIIGMRERAEALGGTLTTGRTADGFEVRASLPLTVSPERLRS
jgi:signal transduction histidine kinase